ncbi:MAG: hypothetical protein M1826_006028 [Phylliscum demangeonii]|nr:MAG: hypothetical protein M1826_006028 [Phylliscum demangeonii]
MASVFPPPPATRSSTTAISSASSPIFRRPAPPLTLGTPPPSVRPLGPIRKRSRLGDSASGSDSTARGGIGSLADSGGTRSPAALVPTTYRLAGGLDTPTSAAAQAREDEDRDDERRQESRQGWAQAGGAKKRSLLEDDYDDYGYFSYTPRPLARESNARARGGSEVWDFCRTGSFHGFQAGGGPSYAMTAIAASPERTGVQRPCPPDPDRQAPSTPPPPPPPVASDEQTMRAWDPADYQTPQETTPPRPAKRIQREQGTGELKSPWMLVSHDGVARAADGRRLLRAGKTARHAPPKRSRMSPARPAHARSPALPSFAAAPRSPAAAHQAVSPDAQRLLAQRRRQERQADASIRRFNQQLKDMIREGKEALGTRVVIEGSAEDADLDGLDNLDDLDGDEGLEQGEAPDLVRAVKIDFGKSG